MKSFFKITFLVVSMIMSSMFTSCDWDASPEYDHPLYITYSITAGSLEFNGPDQLLVDIKGWIKANQIVYDKEVNYTTGEASEFTKTDAEAISKYETFVPKFRAYLEEVKGKLAIGTYGKVDTPVKALFFVSATRTQGQEGTLKYDQIAFTYPE